MNMVYNFISISAVTILIIYQNCLIISPFTQLIFLLFLLSFILQAVCPVYQTFFQPSLIVSLHILSSYFTDMETLHAVFVSSKFPGTTWHFHIFYPKLLMVTWIWAPSPPWPLHLLSLYLFLIGNIYGFAIQNIISLLFFPLLWGFKSCLCYNGNILIIFWCILLILNAVWTVSQWYRFEKNLWDLPFIMNSKYE